MLTNDALSAEIDALWAQTKAGELGLPARFAAIDALLWRYIDANDKRPPASMTDRLATLCLYEVVTDRRAHKPDDFHSERQRRRRINRESLVSFTMDEESSDSQKLPISQLIQFGSDGFIYRSAGRRPLSVYEMIAIDAQKSRKERREMYEKRKN